MKENRSAKVNGTFLEGSLGEIHELPPWYYATIKGPNPIGRREVVYLPTFKLLL